METITIPKVEYETLKKYKEKVDRIESVIHNDDNWDDVLTLTKDVAYVLSSRLFLDFS